ncbi:MAG TPA: AraC family transcriptional regulator ligand-binding domain-containing protein [Thermoanaerobaculia bacterium]|nr:AraC family transcriptional regulator ligand-binding domain-containing protein [Thermoanaerobaculia bacterium]HQN08626.1 AraC family transcriptional regulator ligand-binding domain-containing protein [Thermoanaerobaculia bacterium]HQP88333.1 AraC family transcriptional regulator ligand-binding domain-containing protein [Thermoanaerobaculia bacterium]
MQRTSVLAALTRGLLDAARAIGRDPDALAAAAGLDPAWLAGPDQRVPLANHFRLWVELSRRPDGLALGEALGLSGLGVVGYAMQHGATVGEALEWQQRYGAVVHPDVNPRLERRREVAGERLVFVQVVPAPFVELREPVDAQAAAIVTALAGLAGRALRARWVAFPRARPADAERHESWFSCPVAWGAPALEVAFEAAVLDLPLPRSDARLFGYLARRAESLHAALPAATSFAERARREIGDALARGEPRAAEVARRLAVSERTLSRRIAEEGTGFAQLVDAARRERALLLLEDPSLSASEIAFLLGYAEPAVFFRVFKRWTGETPGGWRRRRSET